MFASEESFNKVREKQLAILDAYMLDFAKHAPASQVMKIMAIWELIPSQLAKENKKFIFTAIKKSARAREYEESMQWLVDAGLIYKSCLVNDAKIPINGYVDKSIFKVFALDVGLLGAMGKLPVDDLIEGTRLFTEFKGSLTENYVAQHLVCQIDKQLFYWASSGRAEVDFIVQSNLNIYPLEVKSGMSKHKKSLQVYDSKYNPSALCRTSLMNFAHDGKVINCPLYAISLFPLLVGWAKNNDSSYSR